MQDRTDQTALRDGLIAVAPFAVALPLTRRAEEGFAPIPITFGRLLWAAFAAFLALDLAGASLLKRRHRLQPAEETNR